ncbi:putative transcription factor GRAS family [Helianthus annuus]|nr:putative transcription factor GRAS family [Helianthus annuus]
MTDNRLSNLKTMKCYDYASILSDQNVFRSINFNDDWNLGPSNHVPQSRLKDEGDLHEDSDFSDLVLKYINQMLMEDDIDEKNCMFQESAALQAAEKSFYNALMVKDDQDVDRVAESVDSFGSMNGTGLTCDVCESPVLPNTSISFDSQSRFNPSYGLFSGTSSVVDGFVDSPVSILRFPDMFCENRCMQFQKGLDEASRFLPNGRVLDSIGVGVLDQKAVIKTEKKLETGSVPDVSRGRKNPYTKDLVEDGRNSKQSAVYSEPAVRSKMFDDMLLCGGAKTHPSQYEFVRKETASKGQPGQPKGANGVKARGKKQKEVVDLRTLLSLCAQSVSTNDQRGVTDLLKQIREHASPTGDGMQRLAHYFSAGLEARMAGSGTGIYKALLSRPTSAVDILKAYHLFLGFRNLLDESVMVDSPRSKVLDLIRKMNPEIFIHGIVNGAYNAPFFLTRFREALFFFSSLFDMLDATVDRSTEDRILVEKTIWGREAMNVIACEGGERIERPETYKQWQVRNQRAGFRQVAIDQEIVKKAKDWAISDYHKDFVIDEDGYWMLQGWKGRVIYAISSWKPAY